MCQSCEAWKRTLEVELSLSATNEQGRLLTAQAHVKRDKVRRIRSVANFVMIHLSYYGGSRVHCHVDTVSSATVSKKLSNTIEMFTKP
jgi:hypothetical protein